MTITLSSQLNKQIDFIANATKELKLPKDAAAPLTIGEAQELIQSFHQTQASHTKMERIQNYLNNPDPCYCDEDDCDCDENALHWVLRVINE